MDKRVVEKSFHLNDKLSCVVEDEVKRVSELNLDSQEEWKTIYYQDVNGETQLHKAIREGEEEKALHYIGQAPHPCFLNILDDARHSALHLGVIKGSSIVVRSLILAGADPVLVDFFGNTPLHLACSRGDIKCADALTNPFENPELMQRNRKPNVPQDLYLRNTYGDTCLHLAVNHGHLEIVHLLQKLGVNLYDRQASGNSILHLLIEKKEENMALALIREFNFNVNIKNFKDESIYDLALKNNLTQIIDELIRLGVGPDEYIYSSDDSDADIKELEFLRV